MANTSDISRGMILNLEGSLYSVVEFGENKTARAAAKVWAKLVITDCTRTNKVIIVFILQRKPINPFICSFGLLNNFPFTLCRTVF